MEILLVVAVGAMCIGCFLVGAKVGQTVAKGEAIELTKVNPIEVIREHKDRRHAQEEQDRLEKVLRNVERYDGTARGQEDIE